MNASSGRSIGHAVLLMASVALVMTAGPAEAAWLHPLEGSGDFRFSCDLATFSQDDASYEAVLLVSIPHRELTFVKERGDVAARVLAVATLQGPHGETIEQETSFRLRARDEREAGYLTLHQVFLVTLEDIGFPYGQLSLRIEDLNRRRPGLAALATRQRASSTLVTEWTAPPERAANGLSVGGVVYLAHAPIRLWERSGRAGGAPADGPWDYVNPLRRYGLEAEALQIYFNLEPPFDPGARRHASARDLRLEITSNQLDFALVDTVRLTPSIRAVLAAGQAAAVYWEMDVGGLPPGSYRLGIAPLDTAGRAFLSGFDVMWRLSELAVSPPDLLGEGRTVLHGDALRAFEHATHADRAVMLAEFWRARDPDPEDPFNAVHAEFQRRIAYVRLFLGGFDEFGARDPRGEVYLLLGEPDSILDQPVPANQQELEDARVMVQERYAPERIGSMVRGRDRNDGGQDRGNYTTFGAIPMPYSYMADVNIRAKKTAADVRVFQLWHYDHSGHQLFPNIYSGWTGGLRFLFVDRSGRGDFVLDATNTWLRGE